MSTEELLDRCVSKDRNAWDEFIKCYSPLVTRSVRYKLNKLGTHLSKSETRDIVQEVFLLIWEKNKLLGVKNTACLKGWLAIVSLNFTSNYCRKNLFKAAKHVLSLDESPFPEDSEKTLGSTLSSPKLNTAKIVESNELSNLLDREISKLGHRQQLILRLNIYDGEKQKDIAKMMNIPEGTVATLIRRSKQQLRKNLEGMLNI